MTLLKKHVASLVMQIQPWQDRDEVCLHCSILDGRSETRGSNPVFSVLHHPKVCSPPYIVHFYFQPHQEGGGRLQSVQLLAYTTAAPPARYRLAFQSQARRPKSPRRSRKLAGSPRKSLSIIVRWQEHAVPRSQLKLSGAVSNVWEKSNKVTQQPPRSRGPHTLLRSTYLK